MRDLTGSELGRYRLTRLIGRGGMASVYEALDPVLDRVVAVKVLAPQLAVDPDFLGRFRHEARAVAGLRHPNIVRVYDFGAHDEQYYMVMEFIDGPSLSSLLADLAQRRRTLPPAAVVRLVTPLCSALDYGHERGMVHRDVKPANLLLTAGLEPVLSDYGIARIADMTSLTVPGVVMGTAHYMSPEQAQGLPVDHRSDIYSLGIVAFEALTGAVPFQGDTTGAVLAQHLTAPVPSARSRKADLPEDGDGVLERVLAKDPDARYDSAGEFAQALRRGLGVALEEAAGPLLSSAEAPTVAPARSRTPAQGAADQTVTEAEETLAEREATDRDRSAPGAAETAGEPPPRPAGRLARLRRSAAAAVDSVGARARGLIQRLPALRRRRTALVAGLAAAVLIGALTAAITLSSGGGGPMPSPSPSPSRSKPSTAAILKQVTALLTTAKSLLDQGMFQQAVVQAKEALKLNPNDPAAYLQLGEAYLYSAQSNSSSQAADAFESAISLGASGAQTQALLAKARFGQAYGKKSGDYGLATTACDLALELDPQNALAHAVLARVAAVKGDRQGAESQVASALATGSGDSMVVSDVGWAYGFLQEWDRAIEYYRQALALQPNRPGTLLRLAEAYRETGRLEDSLVEARQALDLDPGFGSDAHADIGLTLREQGHYSEAVEEFKQALSLDPSNDYAAWALGATYSDWHKYAEALPYLEQAAAAVPNNAGYLAWLGSCYKDLKRYDEARQALERALQADPNRTDATQMLKELAAAGH